MGRRSVVLVVVLVAVAAGAYVAVSGEDGSPGVRIAQAAASSAPQHVTARRLKARPGAGARGTIVGQAALFTPRVFTNQRDGFALANDGNAQYPARSVDGGRVWRLAGPQLHVDAADGAEGVGFVGAVGAGTLFAYGSSVVDVSTDAGRTWWESFLGELVVAVVPQSSKMLVAYVQQQTNPNSIRHAVTWQYVTRDGGRRWSYTTTLGALPG